MLCCLPSFGGVSSYKHFISVPRVFEYVVLGQIIHVFSYTPGHLFLLATQIQRIELISICTVKHVNTGNWTFLFTHQYLLGQGAIRR